MTNARPTEVIRHRSDEHGYAMVFVIVLLLIALLMGAAGLAESIDSHVLTTRDGRQRRAQQAAEAGVQQQLYDATEQNLGSTYNFSGGVLGLSGFLDCMPLQLNTSLQLSGLTAYASTAGICPQALTSSGSPTSFWSALDNHAYYQSEFFSNKKEVGGSGFGAVVEFPEIVSVGCDSTTASTCSSGSSSNVYSHELALLAPTGPEQTVEGMGNVTVNSLSALGLSTAVAINGDISAANNLNLPLVSGAVNVGNVPPSTIVSTLAYGGTFTGLITTGNKVHITGGACIQGTPSSSCYIKRPALSITTTTCSACSSITVSGGNGTYDATHQTFSMSAGTASFPSGDYVFCNFNVTGGTLNMPSTGTGPVRIFILPPNQAPCNTVNTATETNGSWNIGNFTASAGISNLLTGSVNGVANALDPSGVQIYVAGDGGYDNATSVSIGDNGACATKNLLGVCITGNTPATQAMVVYAPTSAVTVNTGQCLVGVLGSCTLGVAGAFEGSLIGDNVTITATGITQDLDIGNFPLYSGVNGFRPVQYIQCSTSVTNLSASSSDTSGC
jgi:hypothetical protein